MTCTGNCNQGRACDCTPDIDEAEKDVDHELLEVLGYAALLSIGSGVIGLLLGFAAGKLL